MPAPQQIRHQLPLTSSRGPAEPGGCWMLDFGCWPGSPTSAEIQHPTYYIQIRGGCWRIATSEPCSTPTNIQHPKSNILDAQSRHLAASRQLEIEDHLGDKHRRKNIGEQADYQGDGESAYRSGSEH